MDPSTVLVIASLVVTIYGCVVESAFAKMECHSDPECPNGFFCYIESKYCTQCVECAHYKRQYSWRSCPKTPSDCGVCLSGYEEEILHNGKLRDICVPFIASTLSYTTVSGHSYDRYIWAGVAVTVLIPLLFYAFCRKGRGSILRGLEDPPPYRSNEMITLTSTNFEERLSAEDHVMEVGQQKEILVQAVPFRQPEYRTESHDNDQDTIYSDNTDTSSPENGTLHVDLHDENTMPSEWTPAEDISEGQLMTFEMRSPEQSPETDATCEPVSKRHKTNDTNDEKDSHDNHLSINLFINNSITIHKPS